jgi:hypothetical protein
MLTYVSLDGADIFTVEELVEATATLPRKGLLSCAQALVNALEGAGDQREQQWKNRIQPYWRMIWPKSRDLASEEIAKLLARLAIAARGEFPSAVAALNDWLRPIGDLHYVVRQLHASGLANQFPRDSLRLLNAIVDDQGWAPAELGSC